MPLCSACTRSHLGLPGLALAEVIPYRRTVSEELSVWDASPYLATQQNAPGSCDRVRLQHDLNASVLFVPECLVHGRPVLEFHAVSDHKRGIDFP
jgi:hypothetical protein